MPAVVLILALAACAAPVAGDASGRFSWRASDGIRLEQVSVATRDGAKTLQARIHSDGPFSGARRTVRLVALSADGRELATSTTRLDFVPYRHVPADQAHVGTFSIRLPAVDAARFEFALIAGP